MVNAETLSELRRKSGSGELPVTTPFAAHKLVLSSN